MLVTMTKKEYIYTHTYYYSVKLTVKEAQEDIEDLNLGFFEFWSTVLVYIPFLKVS